MLRKDQLNRHTRYRPATTARNTATGMYDVHTDPWSYLAPPDRRSNCEWYQLPKIKWPTWCGNVAADSESDRLGLRFAHEQASKQQVENINAAHEQSSTDAREHTTSDRDTTTCSHIGLTPALSLALVWSSLEKIRSPHRRS